jgi:hypothetical protein
MLLCDRWSPRHMDMCNRGVEYRPSFGRVDWPIINCLPKIEHLFISSSYVLHFEWFKVLWEHFLEIIFQMQRKMSNEKITMRKRKLFNLQNMLFFLFLWTFLTLKPHYFLIFLFILNDLKCYRSSSFVNRLEILIATEQHTRNVWVFKNWFL